MKNLKTRCSAIKKSEVKKSIKKLNDYEFEVIHLMVETDIIYKFEISSDERHPNIDLIKTHLDELLKDCTENYKSLSVEKYKERNYLFINKNQYTGIQLM